ncbi:FBP C-terminal treble-clef zinc-finger [Rhodococcoides kroppenstedtii]|uniref:FBP C-terminal treble-clef zinc-finger n=1 Tax=Rhodococcoides kroppenstedtii TaxID=293050 RepID=A0A1I0SYY3_9NOCA|nr:FBP domain-containing protein [Rhodococcus kroppenstedtii]MBT1191352.1 FBP domain-containing protein [Rhodococcus kroppenstedtii]SFA44724.1 FBP C-terminal treble-clef zinc-finger [Rhodococcus kroppenstedtii]
MHILSSSDLRASLVNASKKERSDASLPDLEALDFDALDYLGWRDTKFDGRAYAVIPAPDGEPIGILLRQADATPRVRTQCSWCRDVRLPNDVVFYAAKLAGPAGKRGSTVGTLVCRDFQCSANVRRDPPRPFPGYDMDAARADRIAALRGASASFADRVRRG